MRRYLLLCALFALAGVASAQNAAIPKQPQLGVLLAPKHIKEGRVYVQGQVRLRVRIASPHPFEQLHLDLPTLDDVRVVTLVKPRADEVHVYGQTGYVYETWLALFAQRSGTLKIPPISASGVVSAGPQDKRSFELSWPGTTLTVQPIDARLASSWWLVADDVSIEQSWTPDPQAFRVDDTVQRHVTVTVKGASPEQLPGIEQGRNAGYAVVGMTSDVRTKLTRDGVETRLRQTWDITVQSKDVFYISPIQVDYWDPAENAPASASLAAMRVEPLPRDVAAMQQALIEEATRARRKLRNGALLLLIAPALLALGLLAVSLRQALPSRSDRQLRRECNAAASMPTCLAAVNRWANHSFGYRGGHVVSRLGETLGPDRTRDLVALQSAIFSPTVRGSMAATSRVPEGSALARGLISAARSNRLRDAWHKLGTQAARILLPSSSERSTWQ